MHKIDFRVYYEDTDAGGVVFYGNYLRFAERARTEWLRGHGYNQSSMDVLFVVKHVDIEYLLPAKLDDEITIQTALQNIGRASITMTQDFYKGSQLLAKMKVVLVCVNRQIKPVALPLDLKTKLLG
jgi:acyl-CoA thioester hydrolase